MKRNLVSIRKIDELHPIEGADKIERAQVGGWPVVVKKGEFEVGDPCVFFEIDAFLPADDERFSFLAAKGTKKDPSGRERIRLKTIRLRQQISQGLALPLSQFPEMSDAQEDEDLSEVLDVIKYERPEPTQANSAGTFPSWLSKTDEERIESLYNKWVETKQDVLYTPTLKLDGSSMTVIYISALMPEHWREKIVRWEDGDQAKAFNTLHGQFQVCSRNLMLKYDESNHFWKGFHSNENAILRACSQLAKETGNKFPIVLHFELLGPGVQGNKEKFTDYRPYLFNMQNPETMENFNWSWVKDVLTYFRHDLYVTPTVGEQQAVFQTMTRDEIIAYSDGPSVNSKIREGIVWKGSDGSSFKSVSRAFLLGGGDD